MSTGASIGIVIPAIERRTTIMSATLVARAVTAAALVFAAGLAQGVALFSQAPLPGINGIQADASTGPLSQAFSVAPGQVLDAIEWYGYHLPGGLGPAADDFTLLVNGVDVSTGAPSFSRSVEFSVGGIDVYKYTLDIDDLVIGAGTLELANGPDTQWAWQFSAASAGLTAFTLLGAAPAVPEPAPAALAVLALLACAATVHTRRARHGKAAMARASG
ncbi:MAG: hypothetical protein U1F56_02895 [Rubrivivax sp.]